MRLSNIWHLGLKELRGLLRDPIMLVLILYSFTLAIYSGARAIPETLNRAAISIVDEDQSPLSARIVDAFYPPHFLPPVMINRQEMDARMDARMDAGLDTFALNIPPNFQRDMLGGRQPAIQLNVDATRMTQAFTGSGYIQTIVDGEVRSFAAGYRANPAPPVDLVTRARFNPILSRSWFGAVVQVINSVTMLSIVLVGAALIRERERGTIEHLLVMPVTPFEIMTSKVWSMGMLVLAACAFALSFIVQGLLSIPIQGSIALFLAGTALHLFATTSLGFSWAPWRARCPNSGYCSFLCCCRCKCCPAAKLLARVCRCWCNTSCWLPRLPILSCLLKRSSFAVREFRQSG
jgi:ABC-2 type transport system permease protein